MTHYRIKKFPGLRWVALLLLCLLMASLEAPAQNFFLGVQVNPSNAIPVNSSVTYTIGVTNLAGFDATAVIVTNTLPASFQLTGQTTTQGTVTTNGSSLVFFIGTVPINFNAVMTVTAQATTAGLFTNMVSVLAPGLTNVITLNPVVQVTNPVVSGDLGVSIGGPSQPVFAGDWTTYGITVTNLGPNTVTSISLTNTLPAGVKLLGVSPSSQSFTLTSNTVTFPFTSLTNQGFKNLSLRVQMPTNAGVAIFSVSVGATGTQDTNAANNAASTNVLVADYFPAALLAVTNSAQSTNRQNGLIEQKILVSNLGTSNVDSVRVIVTGLTNAPVAGFTNVLFNATGTNSGNPFVVYANSLAAGNSVELLLQFYVRTRNAFPFTNSQLHAFGVSLPDLTPPPAVTQSTSINFTNIALMASGNVLLQFKSTLGRAYTIVYADNPSFSNAVMALPPVIAPANYVQWIDYGPPATVSKPGSGSRYYRVFLNP